MESERKFVVDNAGTANIEKMTLADVLIVSKFQLDQTLKTISDWEALTDKDGLSKDLIKSVIEGEYRKKKVLEDYISSLEQKL